ncbi:hypothetical protein, partial [Dietzia sp.]|uniref:hypothetical protein n=1 Tax=Dietzia sp. TaxID=1871616 RepID=UPI003FA52E91
MGQFPADAKEAGVLGRIADSRSTHVDKLAEAIGAAGHDLPDPNQAGGGDAGAVSGAPETANTAEPADIEGVRPTAEAAGEDSAEARQDYSHDVPGVLAALLAAEKEASDAAGGLGGYPAALAGSIAANCAAAGDVEIGVRLGVSG